MARFISKAQILAILAFAYALNWLATGASAQADAPTAYPLNETNYRWMLGQEYTAFSAAFALIERHGTTPGLQMTSESEIRDLFREQHRTVQAIRKITVTAKTDSGPTNYDGWAIWLDDGTVVGVKNTVYSDHTTGDPQICIIRDDLSGADDLVGDWFRKSWYKMQNVLPFHAEFTTANLDDRKFSLPDLRVSGAHYESDMMVDEFSRLDLAQPMEWLKHNPKFAYTRLRNIERSSRALVAVLDSGVDYNNPELSYKLAKGASPAQAKFISDESASTGRWIKGFALFHHVSERLERKKEILDTVFKYGSRGWDFVDDDNRPYDDVPANNDDGSTADSNRDFNIVSIAAGDGAATAVLPIRIRGGGKAMQNSESQADRFEDAVIFAEAYGARVINVSFSPHLTSDKAAASEYWEMGLRDKQLRAAVRANKREREQFEHMIDVMKDHPDLLFVLAAGDEGLNGGKPIGLLDADHDAYIQQGNPSVHLANVIVVSALDSGGALAATSVYGASSVQLAAPGGRTEYAAPYVAHAAAWLLSRNSGLTVSDLVTLLRASVIRVPSLKGTTVWGGYLNFDSLRELYGSSTSGHSSHGKRRRDNFN